MENVKQHFENEAAEFDPNRGSVKCVDIAEKMLQIAKTKLGDDARYQLPNFETDEFDAKYDVAVSSLALHHLVSDADKIKFYRQIYQALNPGGIFYNADVVLDSNSRLQELYIEQWRKYMLKAVSLEEIASKWIP